MDPDDKRKIDRINEISSYAKSSWLGLMAYLAFLFITLLGVKDADFFVRARETQLPLVNVAIPTDSFFLFGPILAAALYVYLHLFLIKLWDAVAEAPSQIRTDPERPGWIPLADAIGPWLANDLAAGMKGGDARPRRPLQRLSGFVTHVLIWWAAPLVLYLFWFWSIPGQGEWRTLLIAFCLFIVGTTGSISFFRCSERLSGRTPATWEHVVRWAGALVYGLMLIALSWSGTEGGFDRYAQAVLPYWYGQKYETLFRTCDNATHNDCLDEYFEPWPPDILEERRVAALPWLPKIDQESLWSAFLTDADLVPLPEDWRDWDIARMSFRETWCRREGLSMTICDHRSNSDRTAPPHVAVARRAYCADHSVGEGAPCADHFAVMESLFDMDWRNERESLIDALPVLDLSRRDLRRSIAIRASLVGANLSEARLEGAIFRQARLEGADLREARLEGADLSEARLEGAIFRQARLEGADLREARLEGADLREARLEGADLRGARLEGADLHGTDFRSAEWAGARTGARAHYADLRGAIGLTQAQLDDMIGNAETLLPDGLAPDSGEPFSIPSCWETPPPFYRTMLDGWIERRKITAAAEFDINAVWLCQRNGPVRTGTPLPLD